MENKEGEQLEFYFVRRHARAGRGRPGIGEEGGYCQEEHLDFEGSGGEEDLRAGVEGRGRGQRGLPNPSFSVILTETEMII